MSTAAWLAILGSVVTFAIGYGHLQGKVAALREIVAELKAGRERTGDRLQALESDMKLVKYSNRLVTQAHGVPRQVVPVEESEEHKR